MEVTEPAHVRWGLRGGGEVRHSNKEKGKEGVQPVSKAPGSSTYQGGDTEGQAVGSPEFGFGHAGKINKWRCHIDSQSLEEGQPVYTLWSRHHGNVSKAMALSEVTWGGGV